MCEFETIIYQPNEQNIMKTKTSIYRFSKHIVYLLLTTVLLLSCSVKNDTQEAIKWINSAKKPIKVYNHRMNGWTYNYDYTLIDSCGIIYYTDEIDLTLPDTIR